MRLFPVTKWLFVLFILLFTACGATAVDEVDPAVVGTWELTVPGPGGKAHWVWIINSDGTYEFQIIGLGFPPGHKGKFTAAHGKWTLTSTTMPFTDTGTYKIPDANTFEAAGSLGTGRWRRKQSNVVVQDERAPLKSNPKPDSPLESIRNDPSSLKGTKTKSPPTIQPGIKAYLLGLDAIETGHWTDAVQQLTAAIEQEPENPDYLTARGVAYTLAQQLSSAEKDLDRANRLRANHNPTKLWLATAVGMQGRFEEDSGIYPFATLDQYESAVRRMSHEYGEIMFRQASGDELAVQQARPAHDKAIQSFPTLAKMFVDRTKPAGSGETAGPDGGLSAALRQRGLDRYQDGQCVQAYHDLSQAYQANPDDKEILFYLAECKRQLGAPEGARADYTAVLLEQPNNAQAIVGRALAHAALGDAPAARQGLAEARRLNPQLSSRYAAQIEKDLSTFTTAPSEQQKVALLEQLRKSAQQGFPWETLTPFAVQVVKASQYARLRADEQYQMKLMALKRAADRPSASADDFAELSRYLYEQALIVVGEAVEPGSRNRPYRPQTQKSQEQELAQAEHTADRALTLNPNHPRALAFKGACRFKWDNDWVTAEKYLSRAIDLDDRDPVIQDLFAIVLDYMAFIQATAAADLRSVKTWSDPYYIYYQYPSAAELRRANELDAIARRLWGKARLAIERAISAAPNSAHAYYYRSILAERDKDLGQATTWLKKALELDPEYFEAAQRLSTMAHKIGQTQLALTAQSIATNLVHASAAPMLKLSWIEFSRTAYQSAGKALQAGANIDPSDPRVAAYQGAIARENGDHALAESWFLAAAALEEVQLSLLGLKVREPNGMDYRPNDIARLLAIDNAAASELNQRGNFDRAAAVMDLNLNLYRLTSQENKYIKSPSGLLPEHADDASHLPEPPTIEALIVWSTVHAARSNAGLKRYDKAMKHYEWAAAFESRKPPTMDQGMAVRIPGLWAKLGMVDIALRKGNGKAASQAMQMYGHPSIATKALRVEADRLRNAIEARGLRSGGQTLHDLRDYQRRQLQK